MPRLIIALAVLVAGQTARAQRSPLSISILGHLGPVSIDSLAIRVDVGASRGATFHAVTAVFADLKIPIDTRDSVRGIVGVANLAKMRTYANARISRYLDCGSGMTGANADDWRVYITTFAFVDAVDSSTTALRLAMVGGAREVAGNSTAPVACGSTGALESLIATRVQARLATGSNSLPHGDPAGGADRQPHSSASAGAADRRGGLSVRPEALHRRR